MTLMNFFHDASHVVLWVIVGVILLDVSQPIFAAAAFALAGLTTLWTGLNLSHRISIREKREES